MTTSCLSVVADISLFHSFSFFWFPVSIAQWWDIWAFMWIQLTYLSAGRMTLTSSNVSCSLLLGNCWAILMRSSLPSNWKSILWCPEKWNKDRYKLVWMTSFKLRRMTLKWRKVATAETVFHSLDEHEKSAYKFPILIASTLQACQYNTWITCKFWTSPSAVDSAISISLFLLDEHPSERKKIARWNEMFQRFDH